MAFEPLNAAAEEVEREKDAAALDRLAKPGKTMDVIKADDGDGDAPPANKKKAPMTDAEREALFKDEREAAAKAEKDATESWSKAVLTHGEGRQVKGGDRVIVHIVSHLNNVKGHVYESSRVRGVPLIIIAERGSLVPGLEKALLSLREGEVCNVIVKPAGGYGNRGYVDANGVRTVPGDCTLAFEVEVVTVKDELELWNMDFTTKMRYAAEYRERGNTLFRNKYYKFADEEYEHAMRYLLFNTHPTEEELPFITEGLVAVQLNMTASKLRTGREDEAIKQGALEDCSDGDAERGQGSGW